MVRLFKKQPAPTPFRDFLGDISMRLVSAPEPGQPDSATAVLRDIGERYGVDRVVLRWTDEDAQLSRASFSWASDTDQPFPDIRLKDVPWIGKQLQACEPVCTSNLADLPTEADPDRLLLESIGIEAMLLTPLRSVEHVDGVLALSSYRPMEWTESTKTEAVALGALIASTLWGAGNRAERLRSESLFRAVVEDQTEFIIRCLPDGTTTWVNDSVCRFIGRSREELVGNSIFDWMLPDDHAQLEIAFANLTPKEPVRTMTHHVRLPSGNIAWTEWSDRGIFDADGALVEIQSVGRDITERVETDEALRQSERRYRDIVESSTDLIWETNRDLKALFSNRRLEDILGYGRNTIQGLEVDDLMHPDDIRQLREDLPRLIESKKGWRRRLFRFQHKDGDYRFLESTATPILDDTGRVCGFRGVDRDVTGEYSAAEEIRSNEAVIQLLLGSVNDAVFTIEDETVVDCNPAALTMFDAPREWIVGKKPWQFSPRQQPDGQESAAKGRQMMKDAWSGKLARFKWVHLRPDDTEVYVDISMSRIRLRDGTRLYAVLRDTTEITLANERLARTAEFQSRLAEISSSLLNVPRGQGDAAVKAVLERIGVDYGFDRCNVAWSAESLPGRGRSVVWSVERLDIRQVQPTELPWGIAQVQSGRTVCVGDIDALPEEAHVDKATCKSLGIAGVISVPLVYEDEVLGTATFSVREPQAWDDTVVRELELITDALTNATVRQSSARELARREADLARSQHVAGVGSYRAEARLNEHGAAEFRNLSMSDEALRVFSVDKGYESSRELLARIHPEDVDNIRQAWRKTLRAGTAHEVRYRVVRSDGSTTHVQARGAADSVNDEGFTTVFGTFKDVTEWVEANRNLQTALSEIEELKDQLQEENIYLRNEVRAAHGFEQIIGESAQLRRVLAAAEQVAPTDVTVLITGETGTGKELIARALHDLSYRKDKPMVCVNCAALSAELIESELFGHEKGAFTGAHEQRKGRFELANGGTLFLDEIGEMTGELQAKLLRVIQEGEFERLGSSKTLRTDVRLIAATNRDLQRAVDDGEFRADLYYRISSFPIHMPPLRDRKDDIPALAEYLVQKHAKKLGKSIEAISARTVRFLRAQPWVGNIRELEGTILRALITTTGPILDYVEGDNRTNASSQEQDSLSSSYHEATRAHILEVLEQKNWVIEGKGGAAVALGLAPSSLRSKMKRLSIERPN